MVKVRPVTTRPAHTNGWAPRVIPPTSSGHQQGGRGAGIGVKVAFTTAQSTGRRRSGVLYTVRHSFGGLGDWSGGREGGRSGVRVRVKGEGASWRPRRGVDRMVFFLLFFVLFVFGELGGRRSGSPTRTLCWAGMGYRYTCEISRLHGRSLVAGIRVRLNGPRLQSRRNYIGGCRSLKRLNPY